MFRVLLLIGLTPAFAWSQDYESVAFSAVAYESPRIAAQPAKANRGYPTLHTTRYWYESGHWPSAAHLDSGEHKGQFDRQWLAQLSPLALLILHSDAHDGKVDWSIAFRPGEFIAPTAIPQPKAKTGRWVWRQQCYGNGTCRRWQEWVED